LRRIDDELADVNRQLETKELESAVEKELTALLDKYSDLIESQEKPDETREEIKTKMMAKFGPHLIDKRTVLLKEAKDRLLRLKADVQSIAPSSSFRQTAQPETPSVCVC
ncbi:MAG: hypothetical protein AB1798_20690, partial [Spirochaetota bacterium]